MARSRVRATTDVHAAGALVTRKGGDVLLVHRPAYDDWSFPKGKVDPGEHVVAAAVREVAEETGLDVRLGPPLPTQHYPLRPGRGKRVDYWMGRVVGSDDLTGYVVNDEIDDVAWMSWDEAERTLTYDLDRATLAAARPLRRKTRALVVLRHARARSRTSWSGDDTARPLRASGVLEARRLVPLLAAYDVTAVVTSPSTRCVETVRPYADLRGLSLDPRPVLSEEEAEADGLVELVDDLLAGRQGAVVCSHRPVLPALLDAAGGPEIRLEPAGMLVIHHRASRVVATEQHLPVAH